MAAPIPKPSHLKAVDGNPSKRPQKREVKPRLRAPKPPTHLSLGARKLWTTYVKQLRDCGVLTEIDGHQLADLCAAEDELRKLRIERDKYPLSFSDKDDVQRPSPLIKSVQDQERAVRLMRSDFGLNPVARNKVQVHKEDENDPMAKLIS